MDPVTDDYSTIRADDSMESAGLIKTFIMGAVFEYLVYPDAAETPSSDYETDLKPLLVRMIADNDNFSADDLVKLLGNGDFENGAAVVMNSAKIMDFLIPKWEQSFWKEILLPIILPVLPTAVGSLPRFIKEIWSIKKHLRKC